MYSLSLRAVYVKMNMMRNNLQVFLNEPFYIGSLQLPNRLIQGPLAGFSCAPFRQLFYQFLPPAYCVSEMISAYDVLYKHQVDSRYLYRSPVETKLCYQIAGHDPVIMAKAAQRLEALGADLIDLNCGCPKTKIRKKGAGSALLDTPERLCKIVREVRQALVIPLTVKLRIQGGPADIVLAQAIEEAGADALIVHGRHWTADYDVPSDVDGIRRVKDAVRIPVIANGDIADKHSLDNAIHATGSDAFMIARAGSGNPWIYQELLEGRLVALSVIERIDIFMSHLQELACLESEHQAVLQSRRLVRYYFKKQLSLEQLKHFYSLTSLKDIALQMTRFSGHAK